MNLRDTIAGMPDGETLYIGAASSFFWIGEKKDAIEAIERESNAAIGRPEPPSQAHRTRADWTVISLPRRRALD